MSDRACFWCREEIPEGKGIYDCLTGEYFHLGACLAALNRHSKDYSRSKQGRFRTRKQARDLIIASRPNPDTVAICADWLGENGFEQAGQALRRAFTRGGP